MHGRLDVPPKEYQGLFGPLHLHPGSSHIQTGPWIVKSGLSELMEHSALHYIIPKNQPKSTVRVSYLTFSLSLLFCCSTKNFLPPKALDQDLSEGFLVLSGH